ncbi:MAG: protein phosphatase 2C domain-containing protein [Coriobacteriales bacterium]|nr:protein phosphatase 2C domain-containing protein [Coriobacteriales bacterium]
MEFISAYHTDVGIKKKTNQDSLFLAEAQTLKGNVFLSVICDGMGGLSQGEVASATLAKAFQNWFREELPVLLQTDITPDIVRVSWRELIERMNAKVLAYGVAHRVSLGSTVVALLLVANWYLIVNIGDSRAYCFVDAPTQLTKDQTVVQREVEQGLLTAEQAEADPRRNILLQGFGARATIEPEFVHGLFVPGTLFMLCSDGFRHRITPSELWELLNPQILESEQQMYNNIIYLTEMSKYRYEQDNISVITIKAV